MKRNYQSPAMLIVDLEGENLMVMTNSLLWGESNPEEEISYGGELTNQEINAGKRRHPIWGYEE